MKAVTELSNKENKPRLIPVSKQAERRLLSVFMALIELIPAIRSEFLLSCGYGGGKTSSVQSFMEVSYASARLSDVRPDGLISCKRGSTEWGAFVEAKADGKSIRPDQIQDYAELAAALDIDAIITLSNEFALSPSELPYHMAASKRRKREIYHFAWADLRTFLEGFRNHESLQPLEREVLSECLRFFWDASSGIATYDAMPVKWPEFVQAAGIALGFGTKTQGITEIVHGWQQERRDLCSKLTYQTGLDVQLIHEAGVRSDRDERLNYDRRALADDYLLTATYAFKGSKTQLKALADLQSCRTSVSLQILPPSNKKARAVVSWILNALDGDSWQGSTVSFDWKGRNQNRTFDLADLRVEPELASEGQKDAPKSIRIVQSKHDVRRFKSRKKFIEDVEALTINMLMAADEVGFLSK
ncbi:hypothetical protein [Loktanella sp. Alg231-35]|uniref:hypothetical protein n=1 Tax=Loktanella sp. Alg231-35 TaxID=1922220 RepID=UPI000D55A280|nr:hypothetical protein [Loktanella sp. Alg231-35]